MEWAELVLDYVRTLAWPVFAAVALVLLRRPLVQLLPRTQKAEFLGVSLEFTAEANAVAELAARVGSARVPVPLPRTPAPPAPVPIAVEAAGEALGPGEGLGEALRPDGSVGEALGPGQGLGEALRPDGSVGEALGPGEWPGEALRPDGSLGEALRPGDGRGEQARPTEGAGEEAALKEHAPDAAAPSTAAPPSSAAPPPPPAATPAPSRSAPEPGPAPVPPPVTLPPLHEPPQSVTVVGYGGLPGWSTAGGLGPARSSAGPASPADVDLLLAVWGQLTASAYAVLRETGVSDGAPVPRAAEVLRDLGALDPLEADLAARTASLVSRVLAGGEQVTPMALASLTTAVRTLVAAFDGAAHRLRTPAGG